ncbi:MAG: GNAT family N-acetyltransferase [Eubacteriales bacterium]|nr:GNAT family N-acetyltransferase [Eubacteriales bacterium]
MYIVKRLTADDEKGKRDAAELLYMWWGDWMHPKKELEEFCMHAVVDGGLPQTIIAYDEDGTTPLGMCQFLLSEAWSRPDLSPWLSDVFVREDRRGQGVCRAMMDKVEGYAKELGIHDMYLFTPHVGLYEKWGWEYFDDLIRYRGDQEYKIRLMRRHFDF